MNQRCDVEGELINWSDEAKKPSEKWTNRNSNKDIPSDELDHAIFAGVAFTPSDARVEKIGQKSSDGARDE